MSGRTQKEAAPPLKTSKFASEQRACLALIDDAFAVFKKWPTLTAQSFIEIRLSEYRQFLKEQGRAP